MALMQMSNLHPSRLLEVKRLVTHLQFRAAIRLKNHAGTIHGVYSVMAKRKGVREKFKQFGMPEEVDFATREEAEKFIEAVETKN